MFLILKALANGFKNCFNIHSILLNNVERLLNDVERLLNDVERLLNDVERLLNDVERLLNDVERLLNDVERLLNDVERLLNNVERLLNDVERWDGQTLSTFHSTKLSKWPVVYRRTPTWTCIFHWWLVLTSRSLFCRIS